MAKTMIAYYSGSANPTALTKLAPVPDPTLFYDSTGKTFQVPTLNMITACYGYGLGTGRTPGFQNYQFVTPSLRSNSVPFQVWKTDQTATCPGPYLFGDDSAFQYFADQPVQLLTGEQLECDYITTGGTAGYVAVLAWLDDGVPMPVSGRLMTVRATWSGTADTADFAAWNGGAPLTFDNTLPVGTYAIVGMAAYAATGVAARLVIPGFGWRMGVIPYLTPDSGDTATNYVRPMQFRYGRYGQPDVGYPKGTYEAWGAFVSTTPPQIETLAASTDSSGAVILDLVKIG